MMTKTWATAKKAVYWVRESQAQTSLPWLRTKVRQV
jgi:hypothetical protein